MIGRQTPLNFHTFLESPAHCTAERSGQTFAIIRRGKLFRRWFQHMKTVHGPITGALTGGFFILLGILLVLIKWISNSNRKLSGEDLYGPVILIVAGGLCLIVGFSVGLMADTDTTYQDMMKSPVVKRDEPVRAITRKVETVVMRTRMDEQEVVRREIREAMYLNRYPISDDSRRGSGVIIQVTQPSPAHKTCKIGDSDDRRHSLQSESFASQGEHDGLSRSDPGRLCPDRLLGSPILVKEIPSSRRTSLHCDTDTQEDLTLNDDVYVDSELIRVHYGDNRRGSDERSGSQTNWSKARGEINRSFDMD